MPEYRVEIKRTLLAELWLIAETEAEALADAKHRLVAEDLKIIDASERVSETTPLAVPYGVID